MYDAIVIGLGGMGSASIYELACRGLKVLGLEQFDLAHNRGSSHGLSRIIRLAYFESLEYVPLLRRAFVLWREIEARCGVRLFHQTGTIDAGLPKREVVSGSLRACREFDLEHELLDASALHRRFPGYRLKRNMVAVFQPEGGLLHPELCVINYVLAAQQEGAEIHTSEGVTAWEATADGVNVITEAGRYQARRLVITAGPWARKLIPALQGLAIPERQAVLWTQPLKPEIFQPERFPVFNLQDDEDQLVKYYGFPIHGAPGGFKIGRYHHFRQQGDPETLSREVNDQDEQLLREGIERYFPEANGPRLALETCLFTNSPDLHFILDTLPATPHVAVAAGFSGHGFKFCSVVGEIMAELVTQGETRHQIESFKLERFTGV